MRGTTQARVVLMRAARERRGCRLPTHVARPQRQTGIGFGRPLELDKEGWIVIPREQPEEEAIGEPEDPSVGRPRQLEQPPVLVNRSHFFPPDRLRRGRREEVPPPETSVFLLPDDGERFLVMQNRFAQRGDALEVASRLGHDLSERPILDGETGGLIQPGQRHCMCRGNLQPALQW